MNFKKLFSLTKIILSMLFVSFNRYHNGPGPLAILFHNLEEYNIVKNARAKKIFLTVSYWIIVIGFGWLLKNYINPDFSRGFSLNANVIAALILAVGVIINGALVFFIGNELIQTNLIEKSKDINKIGKLLKVSVFTTPFVIGLLLQLIGFGLLILDFREYKLSKGSITSKEEKVILKDKFSKNMILWSEKLYKSKIIAVIMATLVVIPSILFCLVLATYITYGEVEAINVFGRYPLLTSISIIFTISSIFTGIFTGLKIKQIYPESQYKIINLTSKLFIFAGISAIVGIGTILQSIAYVLLYSNTPPDSNNQPRKMDGDLI